MTVNELIQILTQFDEEKEILIPTKEGRLLPVSIVLDTPNKSSIVLASKPVSIHATDG